MAAMPLEQLSNRTPSIAYLLDVIVMRLCQECLFLMVLTRKCQISTNTNLLGPNCLSIELASRVRFDPSFVYFKYNFDILNVFMSICQKRQLFSIGTGFVRKREAAARQLERFLLCGCNYSSPWLALHYSAVALTALQWNQFLIDNNIREKAHGMEDMERGKAKTL